MRQVTSKRYRCIHASCPEEFEILINEILMEHPKADCNIDHLLPYTCHVWYSVTVNVPETLADKYELRGDMHYCIECPHIDRPRNSNKNQKTFPCQYANYGMTRTDSPCCDRYYEILEKEADDEDRVQRAG